MTWIGVWITAFGVEQQTPSVTQVVDTLLGIADFGCSNGVINYKTLQSQNKRSEMIQLQSLLCEVGKFGMKCVEGNCGVLPSQWTDS